ncbi:MAG: hypothetical protein Q9171_005791 [Xanthocarpia ochracea]
MSLDLLQEFGDPSHDDFINPWASSNSHHVTNNASAEEDDFGDFAQPGTSYELEKDPAYDNPHSTYSLTSPQNQGGLLIDTETTKPSPSPSFQKLNAPLKLAIPLDVNKGTVIDCTPKESTPVTAWPSFGRNRAKSFGKPIPFSPYTENDDGWGDFQEESHTETVRHGRSFEITPKAYLATNEEIKQDTSLLDFNDSLETKPNLPTPAAPAAAVTASTPPKASKKSIAGPSPSNIPPPSVLLSIVVTILEGLPDEIRDIVSSMGTSLMNDSFSSNELPSEALQNKLAVTTASARILAGRKLRWKRDTHLTQRMSIGPANAGKAGGMKLTGVDRTESRREDQEATEVVRLWKQQLGGLKSQIAKINGRQSELKLALPEYSDNMPIRVAKLGDGGLAAPKCCFLCGLKRDERVAMLDVNVEDSFGEWWVDHWGHVDCIRFWEENRDSLKQR